MIGAAVRVRPDNRNDQRQGSQEWEDRRNLSKAIRRPATLKQTTLYLVDFIDFKNF